MTTVYFACAPQAMKSKTTGSTFTFDLSPALEFGPIRFVFDAGDQPSQDPERAIEQAYERLADITERDYLAWAGGGDPAALIISTAVACDLLDGNIKYLRWERKTDGFGNRRGGFYVPTQFDVWAALDEE